MNQFETSKIITSIGEIYPYAHKDTSKLQLKAIVELWQKCFSDVPYEVVDKALLAFVASDTKGYAPMPGQIREIIASLSYEGGMTDGQAWNMVRDAISNSRYHAQEEFNKLPPEIQGAIGSYRTLKAWTDINTEEIETVIHSQFLRSYRGQKEHQKKWSMLPESVKAFAIESTKSLKKIESTRNGGNADNEYASCERED